MRILKCISLTTFGLLLIFLPSCSKPSVQLGMEYVNSNPHGAQGDGSFLANSIIYIFRQEGVSICWIISKQGDVFIRKKDGALIIGNDPTVRGLLEPVVGGYEQGEVLSRGDNPDTQVEVDLGPGDRMPILENAPYKIQGDSVLIDWSQGHSRYFDISGCNSGSEVFTIKNDGLVLESSTQPGYILIMGNQALTPELQRLHDEQMRDQRKARQLRDQLNRLRGQ